MTIQIVRKNNLYYVRRKRWWWWQWQPLWFQPDKNGTLICEWGWFGRGGQCKSVANYADAARMRDAAYAQYVEEVVERISPTIVEDSNSV